MRAEGTKPRRKRKTKTIKSLDLKGTKAPKTTKRKKPNPLYPKERSKIKTNHAMDDQKKKTKSCSQRGTKPIKESPCKTALPVFLHQYVAVFFCGSCKTALASPRYGSRGGGGMSRACPSLRSTSPPQIRCNNK